MIRGIKKQMIVVKPENESAFECAYLILRSDIISAQNNENAILDEAKRLISDNTCSAKRKRILRKERLLRGLPFFCLGFLLATIFIGIILAAHALL